jgi:hypothetical protein
MRLKAPVALPACHGVAGFEMVCDVINTFVPGCHDEAAKATLGSDFLALELPQIHGLRPKFDVMDQLEMLPKVIFPCEGTVLWSPVCAGFVIVRGKVMIVRVRNTAVYACRVRLVVQEDGSVRYTLPLLERQVVSLLMALPIVFRFKGFCAESAAKGLRRLTERGVASLTGMPLVLEPPPSPLGTFGQVAEKLE